MKSTFPIYVTHSVGVIINTVDRTVPYTDIINAVKEGSNFEH